MVEQMIRFVFNVINKHRANGVGDQLEFLTRVKGSFEATSTSLLCPNHGADSSASILLRSVEDKYEFKVLDSCCRKFRETVESELALGRDHSGIQAGS